MHKWKHRLRDALFMLTVLLGSFSLNLFLQGWFDTRSMIPMIFVLGVFIVSWRTQGYFWGIIASLFSVLAVNYAFTYPYWAFDLIRPECISAAVVMLIVATMTGALTTKLKAQEKMKATAEKERSHTPGRPVPGRLWVECSQKLKEGSRISGAFLSCFWTADMIE